MAEAVINIAGSILANLITQALQKVGKLGGVKHELEELRSIVSMLRAVLDDAEKKCQQSCQIKDWVEKLKDAFCDAQDVLEEFNIEATRQELRGNNEMIKKVRTFFSSSNQLAFALKISRKVRAVRERMVAIEAEKKFHLVEQAMDLQAEIERRERKETYSFTCGKDIIGRDNDKRNIKEFLLDLDVKEGVSILPIVGIGGLGKTTLAQCVYNDEMVSKHFNLKMWVCISNDFDVKKIVKNIIACAKEEEPNDGAMERLQNELRKKIDGKRYFLVLDDLWNSEPGTWQELKSLLVGGARGSKILITTRLPSVADITGTTLPYHLEGLSESASLDLLMQMACSKEEKIQDLDMLAIGKEIVKECYGVPLVVRTVGSLLFFKRTKSEWLNFKDYELPEVSQREDRIISILRLSYDRLPSHLKQCFAFCSLFPKDYRISKNTLVNFWMAEGFIRPSNRGQHLEDIAHGYFMDLLWRNFFQELEEDDNGETCKMHDLMHDLACSVAGTECWVAWDDTKPIHERTRRISFDSNFNFMSKLPISQVKASAVRTFLSVTIYWGGDPPSEADLCRVIQSFKRLRILDLNATNVEKVPRSIGKLRYLTCLDLSCNEVLKRLPNSITRLQNLQTLNLYNCPSLEELPKGIRKLVSLQNLNIDGCDELSYMPRGLGQLSSLYRLSHFILPKDKAHAKKYCGLGELNRLNNIRGTLSIENLGSVTDVIEESQDANLREKRSLKVLVLSWCNFNITDKAMITKRDEALLDGLRPPDNLPELIIDGYNGESFPRWMTELHNLVELKLVRCSRCKHFPQFGLRKLKHLHIQGMKSLEYLPGECLGSLTSLESLEISYCPRLTSLPLGLLGLRHLSKLVDLSIWRCEELDLSKDESGNIILDFHGLQSLQSMKLREIPKLESLPQWILQLRSLKRLEISSCPNFKELSEQIEKCEELDISKDENDNILDFHPGFHSLRSVYVSYLPKLTSLSQWLLQARNLEHLKILGCHNLKDIPEQIEALQSLQILRLIWCSSLTSFPEAMRRLTSLTCLHIHGCGKLEVSCKRKAGEDWDKIAHISNIRFEDPFKP